MHLIDTIGGMTSPHYKERFEAEYWQNSIRLWKLKALIEKAKAGELDFELNCPIELLERQAEKMMELRAILLERAGIEGIELGDIDLDDPDSRVKWKPRGVYECFHCGERDVLWSGDFDSEDYGYEVEGIVHDLHCRNCGAQIQYMVPFEPLP